MDLLAGFLVIILVFVLWIVFVPVSFTVNTSESRFEIRQPGTFVLAYKPGDTPAFNAMVFGFRISGWRTAGSEKQKTGSGKKSRFFRDKSFAAWWKFVRGLLQSFTVRKLIMDIDTGDVIWNAKLVPVCVLASRGKVVMSMNFENRVFIDMTLVFFVYKAIWVFIKFIIKH
jgi:hypothetical protein